MVTNFKDKKRNIFLIFYIIVFVLFSCVTKPSQAGSFVYKNRGEQGLSHINYSSLPKVQLRRSSQVSLPQYDKEDQSSFTSPIKCSECKPVEDEIPWSEYTSNFNKNSRRSGQVVGSVHVTSINGDDDESNINGGFHYRPSTETLLGMSGGYKVAGDEETNVYRPVIQKGLSTKNIHNVIPPYRYRKTNFNPRERLHPSTFEVNSPRPSQIQFEGEGEVIQSAPSNFQIQTFQGNGHDFQSDDFQESGSDFSFIDDGGYHPDSYGYPYPYSGYQRPLPPITQIPPTGKQQDTSFGYYYIGRKLWYIPLYFSIYFVLYVGALIIKALARHKIRFPQNLSDAVTSSSRTIHLHSSDENLITALVLTAIDKFSKSYNG